jgi:magnesium chelatase family protein
MLTRRLPTILPEMGIEESLQTTKIHSVAGMISDQEKLITRRPFRAPHHSISDIALIGGGSSPRPGEISLAHNGILFLDELPEFRRHVLEVLRQPLEARFINIRRANYNVSYPASFMLVASMNPCPCGYFNHPGRECSCGVGMIKKYLSRISGPLLDRIDIHIEVVPVPFNDLSETEVKECSKRMKDQVLRARAIQTKRFTGIMDTFSNAQMGSGLMKMHCTLSREGIAILRTALEKLGLSARAYDRILKVSRTIADLEGSKLIQVPHIAEALNYRNLDREGWSG